MAFTVFQDVYIADFRFSRSNGIEIRRSTHAIGSTAIIKTPISAVIENRGERSGLVEVAKAVKVGDPVFIRLGYHTAKGDHARIEFRGYVKSIQPKIPLEIECEDKNYLLRKKKLKKSWKSTTLKQVLNEIIADTGIVLHNEKNIPEIKLEPFYLKNIDGAFALQKLADEYGLTIFFLPDETLYCGLAYTYEAGREKMVLNGDERNVINADGLKFRRADDVKLKIKAIAIQGDNTRLEAEIGDEDGSQRTLHFYNIKSVTELNAIAKQELDKLKYDGYEGKVKCFLIPFVDPAYTVKIVDPIFPDREGEYFVESTKLTYGSDGIRREVEIGIKVNSENLKTA